uniref:DDE Tnp4 domain-containing protein n=1 Tax=Ananas comosus var. bracteatus TaxID=296719 RepID=A0A6V7NW16_ANACO|nr:unnamed protein product [Ananas comosus var. bracteatus]
MGWDYMINIPTAGDPTDWDAVIQENPAYAKCREKPFPAYKDIEFLTGKTTATGRHGFTSQMPIGHEPVDSSPSSSPGHDDVLKAIRNSMINDSEQGQSSQAHMNVGMINEATSLSPSPDPVNPSTPHTDSVPGHSSAGKRAHSSPLPTRKHKQQTRGGRNKKITISNDRLGELADIGRQKLDIAKVIVNRELTARPIVHSIEECMDRLRMINGVTPERCLTALEAFKDERNKTIFLALGDDITLAWIDGQAVLQVMENSINRYVFTSSTLADHSGMILLDGILAEIFQHSEETISRPFNNVLSAVMHLKDEYLCTPSNNVGAHPRIRDNSNCHPFKNAIGAVDGTHLPVVVRKSKLPRYSHRKGPTPDPRQRDLTKTDPVDLAGSAPTGSGFARSSPGSAFESDPGPDQRRWEERGYGYGGDYCRYRMVSGMMEGVTTSVRIAALEAEKGVGKARMMGLEKEREARREASEITNALKDVEPEQSNSKPVDSEDTSVILFN